MFSNKAIDGKNNISGDQIANIRKSKFYKLSQRGLADRLQVKGLDLDKNAVQRIECGKRFVTDIELKMISKTLGVDVSELLDTD